MPASPWPRVLVAGGSIGGLTTALVLRDLGCEVDVYERTDGDLEDRGAGIVVLPVTERWFERRRGGHRVSLALHSWVYVDETGEVVAARPADLRFSGWSTVYRGLLDAFGRERYHVGHRVTGFDQDDGGVTVRFADGPPVTGDLLVFADGTASTGRAILLPGVHPEYAGYVAWRGTTAESALSTEARALFEDAMVYQVLSPGHVLVYAIPDRHGRTTPPHRDLNFVWYRNYAPGAELDDLMTDVDGVLRTGTMPPGSIRAGHVAEMRSSAARLAPAIGEVVLGCGRPLIQEVFDLASGRMAFGRVCLIGDAAATLRPHIAAGQAKACADAWALGDAVASSGGDVVEALARWEPGQLALAHRALERSRAMGRASQFDLTMAPGDPDWRFGL